MSEQETPASLVALEDRRESVIGTLSARFAEDVLSMDEFERRVDLAHRAGSVADLDGLVSDLAIPASSDVEPAAASAPPTALTRPTGHVRSFLSSTVRKGTWQVPTELKVRSFMAAVELDFREAELAPGVTNVRIGALMGAVSITVPPGLRVECEGSTVLGLFDALTSGPADRPTDAPVLRISGRAVMGSVEIEVE